MEILSSVAAKIVELTIKPIVRQVGYLFSYGNNFKELKDRVEELRTTKERIDNEVEAERRNLREIEGDVLRWQESVIETLKEAKQLCEYPRDANVGCSKWSFLNLKSRHNRSRKAKKIVNTIVEMKGKGNFHKGVGYVPHLDIVGNFPTARGSDKLESRNSAKEDIMLSLKDPKVSKIGVYGIGGVGKSTLVREVAKQVKIDKLFDEVVMVTISQTNLERIQDDIAEQLGLRLQEMTSSIGRVNRLCERIKKEKTILIILDDLREEIDLEKLGIPSLDTWGEINLEKVGVPLKDDYKSCKLLLTSRSQDILQMNDTQQNFYLQVLNDKESWSLFEAMIGDVDKDAKFQTVATQVAQSCAGLPVLIVTIAKSLKGKDICYWEDSLKNLRSVGDKDMHNTLVSALEFNLNRLEDEVKKVFLLCSVDGTLMFVSDLLKYVIGLGIFKCTNTIKDARNRLYKIIDILKASCLLVDNDAIAEMIQMHDIVREVGILIASKFVFTKSNAKWQECPRKDIPERCTHIILSRCCIQKLPERLDCPHLTFLHIDSTDNRNLKIPNSFFDGMRNLEALNLTGITIASLPISLSFLTKLKTMCLDQCSLKDMTGIRSLINLEILCLIHSSMEQFPSEIEQLTKLRMLDLSDSEIRTTLPNILCKLSKIEELYMGNAKVNWEMESSTEQMRNASLVKLGHLISLTTLEIQIPEACLLPKGLPFDRLERYKVVIGDKWEWSGNKGTSKLLKVKLDTNIHWEQGIRILIKEVEDLHLDKISGISNVLFELNGEGFPLLKHLHIQNNGEIQHIINSMERNQTHVLFPKLETMILYNLNNLVKIFHGPIRDNSFSQLKVVKVKSCDQLVYLFSVAMVKAFSQLIEIEVSECSSVKKIAFVESTDSGKTIDGKIEFVPLRSLTLQHLPTIDDFCSHELTSSVQAKQNLLRANIPTPFFSAKVKFSNLETLKLSSVNLKKIWDDDQSFTPYLVQNLANLTIEDCSGLKYLFSSSMVGRLSNLKQLEISKCDMMEEIIATRETNGIAFGEVLFPKLEATIIKDMKNLKTVWHLILASNSLACFKTLKVKNCEKIEKIFPEYMNGAFAALETLEVEDCKSVQEIFQLSVNADGTSQLKYVTLLRLPKLKQIWSRGSQSSLCFKNLQVVRVEYCGDLEFLFPFSIAKHLPQLEEITIKDSEKMKEIVSRREEPLDNPVKFELNQLTSIVLCDLHDLQRFCTGKHSLSCSSLKVLEVAFCEKLKLFKTQGTSCQGGLSDDNLHVSMQQPLFALEEVIDNLERLHLNNEDASMIFQLQVPGDRFHKLKFLRLDKLEDAQATFPYWFLQNISSLEWLVIQKNSLKVIFPHKMPRDANGEIEIKTRLKKLTLYKLDELQYICKEGCQLDRVLDVLEDLYVFKCSNLKRLVPSLVNFNHLTYLVVQNCRGMIYLITSSTARSLVKLTTLKITECDLVERIVEEEGGESSNEIEFNMLEVLELESLPKLNSFGSINCSLKLPLLEELVIRQCPRMKTFSSSGTSSPLLREILTDEQDGKWFCDGDLNSTVNKIFQQMVAFRCMERLELSQYPELGGDVWYSHVKRGMFGNLKILVIHKCDFLSKVLLPLNLVKVLLSNLEELEVSECDSLEALFELPNMNEGRIMGKITIHLKRINLSCLPELKHIWKQNSQEIVSLEDVGEISSDNSQELYTSKIQGFGETREEGDIGQVLLPKLETIIIEDMENLETIWHPVLTPSSMGSFETLEVKNCQKIEHIFPIYMHGAFATLETLKVDDCNSVQEIFQLGVNGMHSVDNETRLKNITLLGLPKLKQIWSRDPQSSVPFKSLQVVYVEDCGDLEFLFPFSIANHLPLLEAITIIDAEKMKEIVSKREEPLDNPVKFEFNQLTSMVLGDLQNLLGFYAGNHSLSCSSLKELDVYNCEKLKLFKTQGTSSQGRLWDYNLHVSMQQPLFTLEEVSQNLEELSLDENDTMRILNGNYERHLFQSIKILRLQCFQETPIKFLNDLIQMFPTTTTLQARYSSLKTLFPSKEIGHCSIESPIQIKTLWLFQLQQLEHIWSDDDSASHPLVQNLEDLYIWECSGIIRLAPPSASFEKLTFLEVKGCNRLMYFMTSCTTKSLVHLTDLIVINCGMLEEVVMTNEGESEEEITFESLEYLELNCLSSFKSFCSRKHNFIFPSLVTLKVIGCHKIQNFSSGVIIAPFLKLVEVENGKKCWKEDLNTTIKQLYKAIGEGVEGDYNEASINIQSSQTRQKSASTSRALSSEEHGAKSKADEIVDSGKQQMHKLPIPHTGIDTQKICEIAGMSLDQTSQNTLSLTKVDAAIGTEGMNETIQTPLAEAVESTLTHTPIQETGLALGTQDETIERPLDQATHQEKLHSEIRNQEMYKTLEKASVPVAHNVLSSSVVDNIAIDPLPSQALIAVTSSSIQDEALGTQDETIERPLDQATHQGTLSPSILQDKAIDPSPSQALRAATSSSIQDEDGSQDLQLHLSENLHVQATSSIMNDDEENTGTKEMHETIERLLVQNAEATGTHVTHESIDKAYVQATKDAWDITIVKEKEESHDSDIHLSKNLFNQTTCMAADNKETVGTQETHESKRRFSDHDAQNVLSTTMVHDTDDPKITLGNNLCCQTSNSVMAENRVAIDPAPSRASKVPSSSTTPIAGVCSNFKELDISVQLLPYLEVGVKRHPQVLNWLNTEQRRVFASSSFSLFAEVTRILRTTRRVNLTEDDRSYIRKCCAVLQGVGFDDGWISYVHGRIEERGDGEDLEWKVDEAEAQLESVNKELASVKESLVLLRDKASKLHGYLCLSTLINALLFTVIFFIIIYVYEKKT